MEVRGTSEEVTSQIELKGCLGHQQVENSRQRSGEITGTFKHLRQDMQNTAEYTGKDLRGKDVAN